MLQLKEYYQVFLFNSLMESEKRLNFLKNAHPSHHDFINTAALHDPSKNKQYTQWMLQQHIKGNAEVKSLPKIATNLNIFHNNKSAMKITDINSHTPETLNKEVAKVKTAINGHKLVYEDDDISIHRLNNFDASKLHYGEKGKVCSTSWCTGRSGTQFKHYEKPHVAKIKTGPLAGHIFQYANTQLKNKHNTDPENSEQEHILPKLHKAWSTNPELEPKNTEFILKYGDGSHTHHIDNIMKVSNWHDTNHLVAAVHNRLHSEKYVNYIIDKHGENLSRDKANAIGRNIKNLTDETFDKMHNYKVHGEHIFRESLSDNGQNLKQKHLDVLAKGEFAHNIAGRVKSEESINNIIDNYKNNPKDLNVTNAFSIVSNPHLKPHHIDKLIDIVHSGGISSKRFTHHPNVTDDHIHKIIDWHMENPLKSNTFDKYTMLKNHNLKPEHIDKLIKDASYHGPLLTQNNLQQRHYDIFNDRYTKLGIKGYSKEDIEQEKARRQHLHAIHY